ncbi:glycosyltransferase family 2 protein [Sphaerotilus sp.]|uniref:glycosyltransferase family 2 protein n=1 Tax=Sphaerotilus sp. TaxID=2093942 RepID=UPI002ACE7D9A|nr:glycosyltransferase [Sphaerotilus sp.]MDZ7855367.1 glycosyltransferase [Sphaerotilus sp.]
MSESESAVLHDAIHHYQNKNYAKALALFCQAGERYGEGVVTANIQMCRAAMAKAAATAPPPAAATAPAPTPVAQAASAVALDAATRLMLANTGHTTLDEPERKALLARHKAATSRRSESVEIRPVKPVPADWPQDLQLAPLPDSTNDFVWNRRRKGPRTTPHHQQPDGLSIIVPTFNRSRILGVTLACLVNQKTAYPFEVIVADDGSQDNIVDVVRQFESSLDIKYVRQKDYGYQLCAVRNLGLRTGRFPFVAILDCDMAPSPGWVQSYMVHLVDDDDVALIGPRKYVDTSLHERAAFLRDPTLIEHLPEVLTHNTVAGKTEDTISVDWRRDHFRESDHLRLCDTPFRYFSGGNVAFARKWLDRAGWFDEAFTHWGGEDNEFGYRLYRQGCFFRSLDGAMAYHQEPPGKENETDRAEGKKITLDIVRDKVPYFYRKPSSIESARLHTIPLVSIYIPAYNCAQHIVRCVDSALQQTIVDLEVCICDDGSTDNTLDVLRQHYGQHPRVRFASQRNGGIGAASNAAVRMARGYYIGQLDSDDYLEPDAVALCLEQFMANRALACVYTTNRNVKPDGELISNGYNWPEFSREKLTTAMIAHHFRMFTVRAWQLTQGFDEHITNAVDYDMYLKLSEVGPFKHVNKIAYNRVLHGENTSIKKLGLQKLNHYTVVNKSLSRQNIRTKAYVPLDPQSDTCRKYQFKDAQVQQG